MKNRLASTFAVLIASIFITVACNGADWLTLPSFYTHGENGARTSQYAQPRPPVSQVVSGYRTSGYRQYRSTIQYGQAADNYHRVEKWGPPVRPYGEWRFPFRPYSSPYGAWGAPFAGTAPTGYFPGFGTGLGLPLNLQINQAIAGAANGNNANAAQQGVAAQQGAGVQQAVPFPGINGQFPAQYYYGQGGAALTPYPHLPQSGYPSPPYFDGYHPNYGQRPRLNDEQFYRKPTQ